MRPSKIDLSLLLKSKLLEVPGLVTHLELKMPQFLDQFASWMKATEEILRAFTVSQASEVAGMRSRVLALACGNLGRTQLRKAQIKVAAETLYEAQNMILQIAQPIEAALEECRSVIQQMLAIVRLQKLVECNAGWDEVVFAHVLWNSFPSLQQFHSGIVKLRAVVTSADAVRLIAEELVLEEWEMLVNN